MKAGHTKGKDLHLTPSALRKLTAKDLRKLDHMQLIVKGHVTLAVLVPYDQFCEMRLQP